MPKRSLLPFVVTVLLLLLPLVVEAQKENAHWKTPMLHYDFNHDPPSIVVDPVPCGGVAISNPKNGSLELYGRGQCLYDSHNRPILGAAGSSVAGVPVFAPGSHDTIFFIATNYLEDGHPPRALVIRLARTADSWEVYQTDSVFLPERTGGWALIRHANNRDYWLVSLFGESNAFFASYLLTHDGIIQPPMISNAEITAASYSGSIWTSPDGRVLTSYSEVWQVSRFNRLTGSVSYWFRLPDESTRFDDAAFSANSRYLYHSNDNGVFQYDLSFPDSDIIAKRRTLWLPFDSPFRNSKALSLSLAMDARIYVAAVPGPSSIGRIPHPDLPAPSCGLDSLMNGYDYDVTTNSCNTGYAPAKQHYSYVSFTRTTRCSPQCVMVQPESDLPAEQYSWYMPGAEQESGIGSAMEACYDSGGIYPVWLFSRWGELRDTMVQYVSIAAHPDADAFSPIVRNYTSQAGEPVSIPLQFEAPFGVGYMPYHHYAIRYNLELDTTALSFDSVTAPIGWSVKSITRTASAVTIEIDTSGVIATVPPVLDLGRLHVHLKAGATATSVLLLNLTFVSIDSDEMLCTSPESNIVAKITNSSEVLAANRSRSLNVRVASQPFGTALSLTIDAPTTSIVSLDVFDVLGRRLELQGSGYHTLREGDNSISFPSSELPTGTYYVRMADDSGAVLTVPAIKR